MDGTGGDVSRFREEAAHNDVLYVMYCNDYALYSLKNGIEKVETSECILDAYLQNAGFIKIKKTLWINPRNIKAVSHKPREVILCNDEHFNISRRYWYRVKNIK